MDSTRLFSTGWTPKTTLEVGIEQAYQDFLQRYENN
jgi:nucleoside-diphosphate-sugar epimerase